MNLSGSEGVRMLSFDGSDLRAVSQLNILDELMRRVESDKQSDNRILPCDYFHMMAGVGTGGILVILLAILRMDIEETIKEFVAIWQAVNADATLDPTTRAAKLEEVIKGLLKRKGIAETQRMYIETAEETPCKVFVCAVTESTVNVCGKFRNYKSNETSTNPSIVEAIRATCATPKLFPSVSIKSIGSSISYVTGSLSFNNPSYVLIKEAIGHFGRYRTVEFMASLGAGQRALLSASTNHGVVDSADLTTKIASDCGQVDWDLEWRIGELGVYYRLCVDRALEYTASPNPVGDIEAWTNGYLQQPNVTRQVDMCIGASRHLGDVILEQMAGLSRKGSTRAYPDPMQQESWPSREGHLQEVNQTHLEPPNRSNAYGNQHVSCLEGTRRKSLATIRDWVDDSTAKSTFFLLDFAGSGKSTVAKQMVEEWTMERRLLARFFFSRDTATNMSINSFCWTVAKAFAHLDHNFKAHMTKFTEHPNLALLPFDEVFEGLVAGPLRAIRRRAILIIDALDECSNEHRDQLLNTLHSSQSSIPLLRIFITGRPERDIKRSVEEKFRVGYNDFLRLEGNNRDVENYIKHRLRDLPNIQGRLYPVICDAEGLFIWARIACDLLVDSDDVDGLLEELGREVDLDHLYKTALEQSAVKDAASRRARALVLQIILAAREPLSIEQMEKISPRPQIVENAVTRLSSLLLHQSRQDPVRLLHGTFREFLTSQTRSGDHFVQLEGGHYMLASGCVNFLGQESMQGNSNSNNLDASSKRKEIPFESNRDLTLNERILKFANNELKMWIRTIRQLAVFSSHSYIGHILALSRQNWSSQITEALVYRSLEQIVRISFISNLDWRKGLTESYL